MHDVRTEMDKIQELKRRTSVVKIGRHLTREKRKKILQTLKGRKRLENILSKSRSNGETKLQLTEMINQEPGNSEITSKLHEHPNHKLIYEWTVSSMYMAFRHNMLNRRPNWRTKVPQMDYIIRTYPPFLKQNTVVYTGQPYDTFQLQCRGKFVSSNSLEKLPIPTTPRLLIASHHAQDNIAGCIFSILLTPGMPVLDVNKYLAEVHIKSVWANEQELLLPSGGKLFEVSRGSFFTEHDEMKIVVNCLYIRPDEHDMLYRHHNPTPYTVKQAKRFFDKLPSLQERYDKSRVSPAVLP